MYMTLKLLGKYGKEELAYLYIARNLEDGKIVEFVESTQPPIPREEKWVLILSSLYGCPIACKMCDAGTYYEGRVSYSVMMEQIEYMVHHRFPDKNIPIPKFKIQFARIGEPSLNPDVLKVLKDLPQKLNASGLIPCISTVAPQSASKFMEDLLKIKNRLYSDGHFQLQFSIHSTDSSVRQSLISNNIWSLNEIAQYGNRWFQPGDRKITLNFAVSEQSIIDPRIIKNNFDCESYLIKLTPINPTYNSEKHKLSSGITPENEKDFSLAQDFKNLGFQTIISIGAWEENLIGTNCGQFATEFNNSQVSIKPSLLAKSYNLDDYLIHSDMPKN